MVYTRRGATLGLATLAAITTLATTAAPASAATTTIRKGTATAAPYSGKVQVSLIGTASVSTSYGSGTCNQSELSGSIASDGTGLSIGAATFTNNPGPDCPSSNNTASAVTAENLPWSGGNAAFAPVAGGRDGTVTVANFRAKTVLKNVPVLGSITCFYGGSITIDAFNPDNPNRPDTSLNVAQVKATNLTLNRASGGNAFCPTTATATATYALHGESAPGVFDQDLYMTG